MDQYENLRGMEFASGLYEWDSDRTLLYAVGVGAGLPDASEELQFTTENTPELTQKVIPGFLTTMKCEGDWAAVLGWTGPGGYPVGLVHGEQSVTLARSIPPAGRARLRRVIEGVYDKGSGALVVIDTEVTLEDGEYLGSHRMSLFAQGKGGFGGPRGPKDAASFWREPSRRPDSIVSLPLGSNQSLIYRLLGDRREHGTLLANARADGFERPVFYGLGSFGVACRAMIIGACEGDVDQFGHIEVRMAKPVYPGDTLNTYIWRSSESIEFRVMSSRDCIVLDRGVFRFRG